MSPALLQAFLGNNGGGSHKVYGVAVGIVTNNQDPDGLGRVKVKFPWLSDDDESHWAHMVAPMAGPDRGTYFLPEVDDSVLVAFEQGDVARPFVLGALWNGREKPPEGNGDGKNNHRTIKSRSGHILRFDDSDGAEKIEILDKTGKNRIVISSADNKLTIESDSDLTIESKNGTLALKGQKVTVKSQSSLGIEAGSTGELKAGAQLNVKGAIVNIN